MWTVRSLRGLHTSAARALSQSERQSDVVIVGAGVAGLALMAGLVASRRLPPMHLTLLDATPVHRWGGWLDAQKARTLPASDTHDGIPWENRVISLNMDNVSWLQALGAYRYVEPTRVRRVERIRVWDGLSGAAAEFGGSGQALSVMVELANLQQALYRFLQAEAPHSRVTFDVLDEARVTSIEAPLRDAWPRVVVRKKEEDTVISTRLLIGADGHRSPVRAFAGIESYGWPYGCHGLVATMRTGHHTRTAEPIVDQQAWQRFLPTGTLACLPLSPTSATVVWALPPALCARLVAMHRASPVQDGTSSVLATLISAAFRLPWPALEGLLNEAPTESTPDFERRVHETMAAYEQRAGTDAPSAHTSAVPPWADAVDVRSVASFPLQLQHASCYLGSSLNQSSVFPRPSDVIAGALTALGLTPGGAARGAGQGRTVLVGDAAHATHPLAGQGLNMGLQDVRALLSTLEDASAYGMDIGTHAALQSYERARYLPNQAMLSFTDHLHWLFATPPHSAQPHGALAAAVRAQALRILVWARSTGLEVVNELGPLKRFFEAGAGSIRS
ncbi:Putative ubiquinone biosynthesis monooxygenase [Malassezia nana]|uniref:Ubiquinone biosynthesis monooxygenase n=1 Tax=Malassezia nana TaxID=180528 RepID=A0AAF0EL88_9BASI|nr:Putative ubiquinone biosynthesis monooxygenase [Malassezia nana]